MRAITLCFIMFFFNACQAAPAAEAQAEPKVVASAEAACDCNDPIAKTKPGCDCAVKADNAALKTQQTANAVAAAQGASTPEASSCGGCGEGAKAAGSCGGCGEGAKAAGSCGGCGAAAATAQS